jgi:hypothetical protein
MAGLVPAIHVFAALEQVVDARVKPGHDESRGYRAMIGETQALCPYSAGFAAGGGGAAGGGVVVVLEAVARFSTMLTAMIEPS